MQALDRHGRVLGAVLHQHEAAARHECPRHGFAHLLRMRELVVGIDDENEVDGVLREVRILDRTEHRLDIRDSERLLARFNDLEHLRLDVDGEHSAVGNTLCYWKTEVACACADVGDDGSRRQRQPMYEQIRAFASCPAPALQPARALVPHDVRDLSVQVPLADAVAIRRRVAVGAVADGGSEGREHATGGEGRGKDSQ